MIQLIVKPTEQEVAALAAAFEHPEQWPGGVLTLRRFAPTNKWGVPYAQAKVFRGTDGQFRFVASRGAKFGVVTLDYLIEKGWVLHEETEADNNN